MGNGSVVYAGTTFTLGQPTVPNAITNGAVYTLPAPGNYSTVYLIGAATTTGQTNQPFILTYTDADGPVTETVNMSSWSCIGRLCGRDDRRFHALREHARLAARYREPMISTDIKFLPIPPERW